MRELHYNNIPGIDQSYFKSGKPSDSIFCDINYTTATGHGSFRFNMVQFFPATAHNIKVLNDMIRKCPESYEKAQEIAQYLKNVIEDLQAFRTADAYSDRDKKGNAKITGFIKRYISNLDKIAQEFGLESVTDERTESAKMKKCEVVCIHNENGEKVIKTFEGKKFVKNGIEFKVYKMAGVARFCIIVAGTGTAIRDYHGKITDAPEYIDNIMIKGIENLKKNNAFEKFHVDLVTLCEAAEIVAPELSECLKASATETAPECSTAPQVETVKKTNKPAHNVIKRDTVHIVAVLKVDASAGIAGDRFDIVKDNINGWTATNTRTSENYAAFLSSIRNPKYFTIEKQENRDSYIKSLIDEYAQAVIEKAEHERMNERKAAQVWKPCTMQARRTYAIIYLETMRTASQETGRRTDREKRDLRHAKTARHINLPQTQKNAYTGITESHKGILAPGGCPPKQTPGNRAKTPQAVRILKVTIRGSPTKSAKFTRDFLKTASGFWAKMD